ncbi:MAG TPA: hypothetical protein DD761_01645, partial [Cyanobacteria bacterium UBA11691]|nr:hypothetical protein [Cyanobacteria bacterium UBA11691]
MILGKPKVAIEADEQALPLYRTVEDGSGEATTLNNLGLVHHSIGQPQRAIAYYEQALSLHRAVEDRGGEAVT